MIPLHEPGEAYAGAATLATPSAAVTVEVTLRGHLEPIDGRFHWYGRVARDDEVEEAFRAGATLAVITPHGAATARISDQDPWGRFRLSGLGAPPF